MQSGASPGPQVDPETRATASFAGIVTTNQYNNRLQPVTLSAGTNGPGGQTAISLTYDFGLGTNDNGNVYGITNHLDGVRPNRPNGSAVFAYDQLNRIVSAHTPDQQPPGTPPDCTVMQPSGLTKDWGQSFTIDAWGNLSNIAVERCSTPTFSAPILANNRLGDPYQYDLAGNMVSDGVNSYTYNAENQLKTAAGVTYTYDGDGERVSKSTGKLYWTGSGSDPLTESDAAGNISEEYVFFNGKRMARADVSNSAITAVHFYFSDHLGSASVITSATGAIEEESDYYSFGGERAITLGPNPYKFTGKERDSESGLDNFGARYYGSSSGRFMTPDWAAAPQPVPYADLSDPQSLNQYSYVRNNPLSRADADGHCPAGDCPINVPKTLEEVDRQNQANQDFLVGVGKGLVNLSTSMTNAFITMGESASEPIPQLQPSNDIQALGMIVGTLVGAVASALGEAPAASSGVQANRSAGLAFQDAKAAETATTDTNVVQNLRVTTTSGTRTEIDIASKTSSGSVRLQETKASQAARLTPKQAKAHPEIAQSGATVVSRNKPGYPAGTRIPPTKVDVVRPKTP